MFGPVIGFDGARKGERVAESEVSVDSDDLTQ